MKLLTKTDPRLIDVSILLLRCTVGIVLFIVGGGKVFGWFGGYGLKAMLPVFASMGIPTLLVYASFFTELIGGGLLMIGFLTRPAALAIMINMFVATSFMWPHGFIASDGGAAWPFSLMVSTIIILLAGPMRYSLDFVMLHWMKPSAN